MVDIKTDLEQVFNYAPIKALNMTEAEKIKWAKFATQIYMQDATCAALANDQCENSAFIHNVLVRDEHTGEIVIRCVDCPKVKLQKNYLIRQFANNKLSLSLLNNPNTFPIEDPREEKVNEFFKKSIKDNKVVGLYFHGSVGIGKTYKTISYCNDMIMKNNRTVSYVFLPELVRKMKDNFSLDSSYNKKLIDDCCNADILVLDDFGAEYTSAWFYLNVIFIILNYRCETDKPIIIISNFTMDKLMNLLKASITSVNDKRVDADTQKIMVDRLVDRIYQLVERHSITYEGKSRRR